MKFHLLNLIKVYGFRAFLDEGFIEYRKLSHKNYRREFPGGLVIRIPGFHCRDPGSIPDRGTEIPQASQHGQKQTNKQKK